MSSRRRCCPRQHRFLSLEPGFPGPPEAQVSSPRFRKRRAAGRPTLRQFGGSVADSHRTPSAPARPSREIVRGRADATRPCQADRWLSLLLNTWNEWPGPTLEVQASNRGASTSEAAEPGGRVMGSRLGRHPADRQPDRPRPDREAGRIGPSSSGHAHARALDRHTPPHRPRQTDDVSGECLGKVTRESVTRGKTNNPAQGAGLSLCISSSSWSLHHRSLGDYPWSRDENVLTYSRLGSLRATCLSTFP
jgi:hypothetical protein